MMFVCVGGMSAQEKSMSVNPGDATRIEVDSVSIFFQKGSTQLDLNHKGNRQKLEDFAQNFTTITAADATIHGVVVTGYASPEGNLQLNQRLSLNRAETISEWLKKRLGLADSLIVIVAGGIDNNKNRTYEERRRSDVMIKILSMPKTEAVKTDKAASPTEVSPEPVTATVTADTDGEKEESDDNDSDEGDSETEDEPVAEDNAEEIGSCLAVHTNLLYDALAIPNLGAEIYLSKNWSLVGNWHYAWWESQANEWSWRTYGGYLALRHWFNGKNKDGERVFTPFAGHHVGVYGQILLYDFALNGKGYLSGLPKGNIDDHPTFGAGIEYGYSRPLTRRISLDFTLGLGYLGGRYDEYKQKDDKYIWQVTKDRHWFGPTRLEVNLVWLLGRGNVNLEKGGRR